ncbi:MAG: adenylosuccinate lyase, partial [Bacillales bacterium]|nr:adenylosuccinate lyase [Bacillales bacterium]
MISRYCSPLIEKYFSDQQRYDYFLKVELAVIKAYYELGFISETDYNKLNKVTFELNDIYEYEKETKHDVIAFINACTKNLGNEAIWFHYGLTSTDIVDSANGLLFKDINKVINNSIDNLKEVVKEKALKYKNLMSVSRTHGQHAEPTIWGLKFLLWYEDLKRIQANFNYSAQEVEVCKIAGAVGNYTSVPLEVVDLVSKTLGLSPAYIVTQTLQRDRYALHFSNINILAKEIEKMALTIRSLARSEIAEVSEAFSLNQKGSSAMPHKRNTISSENVTGLARLIQGYTLVTFENIPLWDERDISHSSSERIVFSDAFILLDYILERFSKTIKELVVNEDNIKKNLHLAYDVIYTPRLLKALLNKGWSRTISYDYAQKLAFETYEKKLSLNELQLKVGIFGAEPWTENMRKELEEKLNIKGYNTYGLTEMCGPDVGDEFEYQVGP